MLLAGTIEDEIDNTRIEKEKELSLMYYSILF